MIKTKRIATYRFRILLLASFFVLTAISSCEVVKPYQKAYLNDQKMQPDANAMKKFDSYFQSIREGAIMPGSDKSSGGCGCN